MLRQIEQSVKNRPITKNGHLPLIYFFENLILAQEPLLNS